MLRASRDAAREVADKAMQIAHEYDTRYAGELGSVLTTLGLDATLNWMVDLNTGKLEQKTSMPNGVMDSVHERLLAAQG